MALKWQLCLRDNSDASRRAAWIQADISLPCGITRQEGVCPGEIKFPVITFGRYDKWKNRYTLFDDPQVLGGNAPTSLCPECGVQVYLIRKMRDEVKNAAAQWISTTKESVEVDEAEYFKA